jgi:hypothetical protein
MKKLCGGETTACGKTIGMAELNYIYNYNR